MFKLLKVRSKPINILYNLSLLFLWIYPFINIFTVTFVDGHDFSFHLWRILALKKEIDLGKSNITVLAKFKIGRAHV